MHSVLNSLSSSYNCVVETFFEFKKNNMACNFSCFMSFTDAQKENDVGVFHSDSGDVYRVKYKSNVCRDLLLRIEWTVQKQILFTVKLYSTSFKRCFSSKGMVINGKKAFMKLRGAFNVSNSRNYKVLCVINLIPYIKFNDNNELPAELFDNSGCVESEYQQSSVDENNAFTDEETCFRNKKAEKNIDDKNNFIANVNEINIPNKFVSVPPENGIAQVASGKKDSKLQNLVTDEMLIQESNMTNSDILKLEKSEKSVSIMKEGTLSSCDYSDTMVKNTNIDIVCIQNSESEIETDMVYIQNSESRKNDLKENFSGNHEDALNRNSDKQNHESALSNNASLEENIITSDLQDKICISKVLTVDDYSEEIIENIKSINIHNNLESNDTFPENNSSMDVDVPVLSSESHSALYDEDISLSNSDHYTNEKNSENTSQEIILTEEIGFQVLSEHKDEGYSQDNVKSVVSPKDNKANFMLESDDISMNKNQYDKLYGEKHLTNLSNTNIDSHIQNSDLSKIMKYVCPSTLKSDSPTTDSHKSSEVVKIAEVNDTTIDSYKSESPKLSSLKTGLVFQTLTRKLSLDDCDFQLTDVKEKAAGRSSKCLKNSSGSQKNINKTFPIMENELKGLSMDMLDLLTSGDMADAQITNGEKHIKVHRAIISARSSSIRKLFVKHVTDDVNYTAVVEIPSYILEDVIIFLYVGLVYIKSKKMAQDLYQVAESYCINDLIDICSKYI